MCHKMNANLFKPNKIGNQFNYIIFEILETPVISFLMIIATFCIYLYLNTLIAFRKGDISLRIYSKSWWKLTIIKIMHSCARTAIAVMGIDLVAEDIDIIELAGTIILTGVLTMINAITTYEEKEIDNANDSTSNN